MSSGARERGLTDRRRLVLRSSNVDGSSKFLHFRKLDQVPITAVLRAKRSVCWVEVETGSFHMLRKASQIFELADSHTVVAVVADNAMLIGPDGDRFLIDSGIWEISTNNPPVQLQASKTCLAF